MTDWNAVAKSALEGKKIVEVEYMTPESAQAMGWYERGVMFWLDDGTHIIVSQDDEGNGPGALFTSIEGAETLPVLRA